ncbi:MAG: hypothetical protein ACFFCQ_12090 [Promethearchaeota archaeon]
MKSIFRTNYLIQKTKIVNDVTIMGISPSKIGDKLTSQRLEICDCGHRFPAPSNAIKLHCTRCGEIWYT